MKLFDRSRENIKHDVEAMLGRENVISKVRQVVGKRAAIQVKTVMNGKPLSSYFIAGKSSTFVHDVTFDVGTKLWTYEGRDRVIDEQKQDVNEPMKNPERDLVQKIIDAANLKDMIPEGPQSLGL